MRTEHLHIRCTDEEKKLWERAAEQAGVSLSKWIVATLQQQAANLVHGPAIHAALTKATPTILAELDSPTAPPVRQDGMCARCTRMGTPSCDGCRKRAGYGVDHSKGVGR